MSGIAGLFYPRTPKPVEPSRLQAMAEAVAHRGPDGAGTWLAPGIGLAHRRLAVIDLDTGGQPMRTADGAVVTVFDGAIYNFHEVRAALEALGARFETQSDTEVLLQGWLAWGPDLLRRLNGTFAFAIYDAERQCLFLARDRFGVKPLVYAALSDGALAFASEIKGLAAHPLFRREADLRAVEDYMAFGYVPDDASFLVGARKLPAGHFLLIERGKPVPEPAKWWDVDFFTRATGKTRDLEAELRERMREAVRMRMIAEVPVGALLSGGMDSSAVVALMAEASRAAVRTCTIGLEDGTQDEAGQAARIAERFRTEHRSRAVPSGDFGLIDTLVHVFDEPFADPAALTSYRACELARETMTVALSGDGADETLAGYRRHRLHAAEEQARKILPQGVRAGLFGTLGRLYPQADWAPAALRARTTLLALSEGGELAYPRSVGITPPELRQRLYSDAARKALGGYRAEQRYVDAMRQAPARDGLDRAQYADIKHGLPGNVLTRIDRTSMATGLEARVPLLDHRLVEFAATLPAELRIRAGQGKWLMKKALEPYLPRQILYRPNTAPVTPASAWFRGALAEEAAMLSRSTLLASTGWFDLKALEKLAADHRAGRAEHGRTLWQLEMLERSLKRLFG